MKDGRALYLDWPSVAKLFAGGLTGVVFFAAAFVKSDDVQGRWASCLLGLPFLLILLVAVLAAAQKWIDGEGGVDEKAEK